MAALNSYAKPHLQSTYTKIINILKRLRDQNTGATIGKMPVDHFNPAMPLAIMSDHDQKTIEIWVETTPNNGAEFHSSAPSR